MFTSHGIILDEGDPIDGFVTDKEWHCLTFGGGMQSTRIQMSREKMEDLRFQINCMLDDRVEPVSTEGLFNKCDGCSHMMNDHDGEGCTGWTDGVLCLCEVTA